METKYAFVARSLAGDIASGERAVGSLLPNEFELADQFGVSRATVRSALRELQQLGLVSRRRNAGTRVEAPSPVGAGGAFGPSLNSIEDLVQYAADTERVIQSVTDVVADDVLAGRLGLRPGRRLLKVSHLRRRPDPARPPICWTDIYLDEAFAGLRDTIADHKGLVGTLVERQFGRRITEIRQSIRAAGVPIDMAASLDAVADDHALEITRRYLDANGAVLLATISVHPATRFTYETKLSRQKVP